MYCCIVCFEEDMTSLGGFGATPLSMIVHWGYWHVACTTEDISV